MYIVIGKRHVAGESTTIQQQDFVAFARQQKCCRRAGAARTNNNGIVHGSSFPATTQRFNLFQICSEAPNGFVSGLGRILAGFWPAIL
jgi:hypothetical protein